MRTTVRTTCFLKTVLILCISVSHSDLSRSTSASPLESLKPSLSRKRLTCALCMAQTDTGCESCWGGSFNGMTHNSRTQQHYSTFTSSLQCNYKLKGEIETDWCQKINYICWTVFAFKMFCYNVPVIFSCNILSTVFCSELYMQKVKVLFWKTWYCL